MGRAAGDFSLPRSGRLRRPAEIQALFQRGNRDERRSFVALWRRSPGDRRAGFAVSRRAGNSVNRNRARRRIREAYRRLQHGLPGGIEVVFVGRAGVGSRTFTALLEEMREALAALARAVAPQAGSGVRE